MRRVRVGEHRCGAAVLIGDCENGFETHADPGVLDVQGEAIAVLTGRPVLELRRTGPTSWVLDHRTAKVTTLRLTGQPASYRPALAEHICGSPLSSEPGPSALELITPSSVPALVPYLDPPF